MRKSSTFLYLLSPIFSTLLVILSAVGPGFSQPMIEQVCSLSDYQPTGGHSIWLDILPGASSQRFNFDAAGGTLTIYNDGTANVTGRVIHESDASWRWDVDIWLENRKDYNAWTALGRSVKVELAPQAVINANKQDWLFWELDPTRSRITGSLGGFFSGDTLLLDHKPANFQFGFQMGMGANAKNGNFGISGWFFYSGSYSGHGDLNANANCGAPNCDVAIDNVSTNCLNDSTFETIVTISGSGNNIQISDDQGTSPLTGLSPGTYNFGSYANDTDVTIIATDMDIVACADTAAPVTDNCTPVPVCDVAIDSLDAICTSDTTFEVKLTISGTGSSYIITDDQGSAAVTVTGSGTYSYGSYANNTSVSLNVSDANIATCDASAGPVTADCAPPPPVCDLTIDSLYVICASDTTFEVLFNISGSGTSYTVTDNQGSASMTVGTGGFSLGIYPNNTSVSITVTDDNDATCTATAGPVSADCGPPPVCEVMLDSIDAVCKTDSTFEIHVTFTGVGNNFQISDDQGSTPLTGLSSGTHVFGEYFNSTDVKIYVSDPNFPACADTLGPVTADCTPVPVCDLSLDTVYTTCISADSFQLNITISGTGVFYQFSDNQGSPPVFGFPAGTYTYGQYANGTNVVLTVTDLAIFNCFEVSSTITDDCSSGNRAASEIEAIYPNPARETAWLDMEVSYTQTVTCELIDTQGRVISTQTVKVYPGEQHLPINCANLQPGVYMVKTQIHGITRDIQKLLIVN